MSKAEQIDSEIGLTELVGAGSKALECHALCEDCERQLEQALARVNRPDERLATGQAKGESDA